MKKILTIIFCLSTAFLQAQTTPSMEDLIAISTETPSPQLKLKMPLFYSNYEGAKNNDELIKQFFFLEKRATKGITSVMSGNVIFVNQDTLLKCNDKITESKALQSLFSSIGFIHAYKSGNFIGRDTDMLIRREIYITKYQLNRALGLNDGGVVLKLLVNKIKANGFSVTRLLSEPARSIMALPLYQQILNYTNSNIASEKPKETFDLTLIPIEPIKKQGIAQTQTQSLAQPIANSVTARHSGLFIRKGKESPDMVKLNKLLKDFDVVEDFTSKSTVYKNKYIGETYTSSTLFITIHKLNNSFLLELHIIYVEPAASFINSYTLHADNSSYPISVGENAIRNNGMSQSGFIASFRNEDEIKFFELFAKAKDAVVYYNGEQSVMKNSLSGREQKRIQETLELFNELTQ